MEQLTMQSPDSPPNNPYATEDSWAELLKPIPNPYTPGMGFDYGQGSCLMHWVDLQRYIREHSPDEDSLWSIVDDEDDLYISHGLHSVNVLGYIVTKDKPTFPLYEDILVD
jgi:hypothetical protein